MRRPVEELRAGRRDTYSVSQLGATPICHSTMKSYVKIVMKKILTSLLFVVPKADKLLFRSHFHERSWHTERR